MHESLAPSLWVQRWSHLAVPGTTVLDVACGAGRHLRWFAQQGHPVLGLDRDGQALQAARQAVRDVAPQAQAHWLQADIENGPWPLGGQRFGAVVVTNYLWRPLLPALLDAVGPGGVLLYETFAAGNETVGRPARPDFLLQPGELLRTCAGLRIVAFEDGFLEEPARFVQRVAAVREIPGAAPARHRL